MASHTRAEPLSPERQREILRDGLNAFDAGVDLRHDDPPRARAEFEHAAAAFESLLAAGVSSAALHYNLGNTYYRLDDLGHAIQHYRSTARRTPNDDRLLRNLKLARDQVEPYIAPAGESRLWQNLLFWHYGTSIATRFWAAVLLSISGWGLLLVRLRFRAGGLTLVGIIGVLAGLAAAGSVGWQLQDEEARPPAVVVSGDPVLRLGRGEGYDPAMAAPLRPGVELRILQTRGDWVEVMLVNDQTGWIPRETVELVQ